MKTVLLAALMTTAALPAFADSVTEPSTGAAFETPKTVDGKTYVLTGAGVRKKFIVKVYALGMYVEKEQAKRDYQAFKARPGADPQSFLIWGNFDKMGVLHFVRSVDLEKIRNAFKESLEDELNDKAPPDVKKATEDFLGIIDKDIKDGQDIIFKTSATGQISVEIGGSKKDGPQNVKLARAIWNIWFGAKPISADIKKNGVSRLDSLSQ